MKNLLFALVITLTLTSAAKAEIQFNHGPWKEILAQAGKENKIVFVDAYTSWCGPCKWMAANTFTNPEVAAFFNSHFVNAKIDMENGEGPMIAEKYHVTAYPTLLFVNATGELIHTAIGALDPVKFLALGKSVFDPEFQSLASLQSQFEAGNADRHFLAKYILALAEVNEDYDEALQRFMPGTVGEALLQEDNWAVFTKTYTKFGVQQTQYFLDNLAAFKAKYGEMEMMQIAIMLYAQPALTAIDNSDQDAYKQSISKLESSGLTGAKMVKYRLDMLWYTSVSDIDNYATSTISYVKESPDMLPGELNNLAWSFYETVEDNKALESALDWAIRACAAEPTYPYLDTKAMLLYKLGRKKDAIAAAKAAIKQGKADGEDYSATENALKEMK